MLLIFFFFNDTATTEIYTLSLHDALPISHSSGHRMVHSEFGQDRLTQPHPLQTFELAQGAIKGAFVLFSTRSEEHTSELQSRLHLVCRLLLEKKKKIINIQHATHIVSTII